MAKNINKCSKLKSYDSNHKKNDTNTLWRPTYRWYIKTASFVLILLSIIFFILNILLKPYMREISEDITPWLKKSNTKMLVKL
jgi:hypothetical protein